MKRIFFFSNRFVQFLFILSLLSIRTDLFSLYAQETSQMRGGPQYYITLKNEEFLRALIPKEKYLLGIAQCVNEEILKRRSEGLDVSDLGFHELDSPKETVVEEYVQEFEYVLQLLDEIAVLERKAKKKVDLEVLEILSGLRERVREIIEGESFLGEVADPDESSKEVENVLESFVEKEVDGSSVPVDSLEDKARVEDYFEQWKYNSILDYKVKLTEYELLRTRLLGKATPKQEKRMFQRHLKLALENYSIGDFPLARIQLQDILDTYSHYQFLDDVLFYCSESSYGLNYFDEAVEGYKRLVNEYPESVFCAKALVKLIYIYYIYGEYDLLSEFYQQLLACKELLDSESSGSASYLVGYAYFKSGEYKKALESLGGVDSGTTYFFPALYLSAACYSNIRQDDLALSIYQRLIEERNKGDKDQVLAQIKNNALLKLGLIYYDRGENNRAIAFFNRVSEDFQHYDLSVIGKAWSAYRSGRPGEALRNVEWLLRHSMVSNYLYEAKVLAASSKQLLGHSEEAIEDLKQVFRVGKNADQVGKYPAERTALLEDLQALEEYQLKLLEDRDRNIFTEIQQISRFLQSTTPGGKISDSASEMKGGDLSDTAQRLSEKIEALDRLEEQARESGNKPFLENIRRLRSDLIRTLQDHTGEDSETFSDPDVDPLIRRMGMSEYLKFVFSSLLQQTVREKEQSNKNIRVADELLDEARRQDQYDLAIQMEINKEELQDYYRKLNQYEVWLRENFPREFRVELDQWASFSGYGISNINFSRIKESETRVTRISQTIDALDQVFKAKRKNLENRIRGLLSDVAKIEEQMRLEVARREQAEKEEFFKTEYFERQRQEAVVGKLREKTESGKKVKK